MSVSATEYVNNVTTEFKALMQNPELGQLRGYQEACLSGVLDPDSVDAFNSRNSRTWQHLGLIATVLKNARTPEGDKIFLPNGYIAYANETDGIVGVMSSRQYLQEPLISDPAEKHYPGYGRFSLVKTGRAVVEAASRYDEVRLTWSALGHAWGHGNYGRGLDFAGASGLMFAHPIGGTVDADRFKDIRDIRGEIMAVPGVQETLAGVKDIDYLAGLADRTLAQQYVNSNSLIIDLEQLLNDTAKLIAQGAPLN